MFKYLKDIIQTKKPLKDNLDLDAEFIPYMTQRWLSMYSKEYATILNHTTNSAYMAFESKNEWYKFLQVCLPCNPNKYIKYIKKNKKEKDLNDHLVTFLSQAQEISKREAREKLLADKTLFNNVKKALGEIK
jgi:hypothetical protein